jgi:hypothetical protein
MGRFDLIEVTAWAGLLNRGDHMGRFDLIEVTAWAGLTVYIIVFEDLIY